ncbi:MAG: Guanylate kinase [Candidatus Giovannonibacteria bacterium GW2011_GWA2_53_7]|uniref:Guanylate kinase n=1 Tax=Candidatus Giovannonibacteria bacterium GW2011_GWA2_53_7 TaxID=1618650 RepID=A0A0G1XUH1_9BACT|nr:MAG: Guanylate kinase [Candidatus Giovannonibacteria bacterium GW2011_GWA2_53_7]
MSKNVVVIAGPSGSGKNAIMEALLARYPKFERLVTTTTRMMRPGEVDGVDYHFFTQERFDAEMTSGNIPEHRFVPTLNTYYGIYKPDLDKKIKAGKTVIAAVDIEGARYLKNAYHATTIFIMPESLEQFKGRLRVRNPEWSQREFDERMKITENELRVHAPQYDYRIINANGALSESIERVVEILHKEGYTL